MLWGINGNPSPFCSSFSQFPLLRCHQDFNFFNFLVLIGVKGYFEAVKGSTRTLSSSKTMKDQDGNKKNFFFFFTFCLGQGMFWKVHYLKANSMLVFYSFCFFKVILWRNWKVNIWPLIEFADNLVLRWFKFDGEL